MSLSVSSYASPSGVRSSSEGVGMPQGGGVDLEKRVAESAEKIPLPEAGSNQGLSRRIGSACKSRCEAIMSVIAAFVKMIFCCSCLKTKPFNQFYAQCAAFTGGSKWEKTPAEVLLGAPEQQTMQ